MSKRPAAAGSGNAKRHVVIDRADIGALPGYDVLKELKTNQAFMALRAQLKAESTPSPPEHTVPAVVLDSVNRAHAAQGLPPVHAVPVAVDQEQRVPVAEPIIRTAIAEGPTDDDGATTGEVPQPPPPPTPVNPAAIQVAPESVATLLTQEALQSQPLRHVSTGAATAEAPSEPQPQWLKPLTPLRTINPPQTAEPASVRPAEPPHPDDGPRVMHSFTDALTPAIDLSRPSRAIRRELHFAPWAEPLERMLEQRRVAMFVDGDRGCIKWLPRTATLAQALVYMRDSDVSGVPLYDGDQPVALLELADVAAFLCKAVRASPFEDGLARHPLQQPCHAALFAAGKRATDKASWWINAKSSAVEILRAFAVHGQWRTVVHWQTPAVPSGVISQTDMIVRLAKNPPPSLVTLRAAEAGLFTADVLCVESDTAAGLVFGAMAKHKVSGLAIVENDRLIGQVCVTDILALAGKEDAAMLDMPISHFLTSSNICCEAVTCAANITVLALMELFAETRTHRVFAVNSRPHHVLAATKHVVPEESYNLLGVATLAGLYRAICGFELHSEASAVDLEDGDGSLVDATAGVPLPSVMQ